MPPTRRKTKERFRDWRAGPALYAYHIIVVLILVNPTSYAIKHPSLGNYIFLALWVAFYIWIIVFAFQAKRLKIQSQTMDAQTFFAGFQALAAFLQVWQTSRNQKEAEKAYRNAKAVALESADNKAKASRLEATLRKHPVLGRLLENRFGRCEDKFEKALREENEDELDDAAKEFVKCKCLIIQAIRTAQGSLEPDLEEEWERHGCEVVLGT